MSHSTSPSHLQRKKVFQMISQEVRKALSILHEQATPDRKDDLGGNAGDCWAELIGAVIGIARTDRFIQNGYQMTKDEIIRRAFMSLGFDMQDLGLMPGEEEK